MASAFPGLLQAKNCYKCCKVIEICDNILLYYNTKFVNISNFIVRTCKNSVIISNPYVIYCKTGHLHSCLQLFLIIFLS